MQQRSPVLLTVLLLAAAAAAQPQELCGDAVEAGGADAAAWEWLAEVRRHPVC